MSTDNLHAAPRDYAPPLDDYPYERRPPIAGAFLAAAVVFIIGALIYGVGWLIGQVI